MARDDLLSFCVYNDKKYTIAPHTTLLLDTIQKFMEGKIKRLILQLPPRSWKSRAVQEAIARYMWKTENTDILYTWHSLSLLQSFSRNIRERIKSDVYHSLFSTDIKDDNAAINSRSTDTHNSLSIYWVWWSITGKWWHRIIIDDPYSSRQDAESDAIRRNVQDWYSSTLYTRRQDDQSGIAVIMQRWREDDLVWYLHKLDNREVVTIPAIDDKGQSFRPQKFSIDDLRQIERNLWVYFFSSQYMQDPAPATWGDFVIDNFIYKNNVIEKITNKVMFVDPAISQKQDADDTAIVVVGMWDESYNIYVLDILAEHMMPDEIINNIFAMHKKHNVDKVWIETVAYQKMLLIEIQKKMQNTGYYMNLEEVRPQGEKEARIKTVLQPRYSNKKIIHMTNVNNTKLEKQLITFPNGKHDDVIDALAGAVSIVDSLNNNFNIVFW